MVVDLIVTESSGEQKEPGHTLGHWDTGTLAHSSCCCPSPPCHSTACPSTSGPPRPGRARQLWGPLFIPFTLHLGFVLAVQREPLAIGPSPNTHGPTRRSKREDRSCRFGMGFCKHDGNGKRG